MAKAIDLTGKRFGRIVVESFSHHSRTKGGMSKRMWKCVCDCGNISYVATGGLTSGNTKSCGCLALEVRTKHGMSDHRIYHIWEDMKHRCDNPNNAQYSDYGGRGISYTREWKDFIVFYEDMREGYDDSLTLDRIDPNGNYSKENCKWSSTKEQGRNRTMPKTNKTGVMGVCKRLDSKTKKPYYAAEIQFGEYKKSKWFSVEKYGEKGAFTLACEARKGMLKYAESIGEGFSENHGKIKSTLENNKENNNE